jgi:hypothetical protein
VFMLFMTISRRHSFTLFAVMSADTATATATATTTIAPESVTVVSSEQEYWPLTLDAIRDCDLSYLNDKWSEDMIRDGMRSIIRAGLLPQVRRDAKSVWTHLSNYSPPSDRGFQFSYGDDHLVTLVQDNMEIGHSGCSMGWTMRNIEFIAKNGLPTHREKFLNSRSRKQNN